MEASRSNVKGRRIVREREQKCSAVQAGRKEGKKEHAVQCSAVQCSAVQCRLEGKKEGACSAMHYRAG